MNKTYDPNKIRRCVRHEETTADGTHIGVTKSFTNEDDLYHPSVDADGSCHCDCADFLYRKTRRQPQAHKSETLCKHLRRYVARREAIGELPIVQQLREEEEAQRQVEIKRIQAMTDEERARYFDF